MPSQPPSWRVYSPRSTLSRMEATIGAAARSPAVRPSAVARETPASTDWMANSKRGRREATRLRTAASPWDMRSSQGSMPSGATATKVCAAKDWSSWKALSAAFCPAASPSKVKTTSPP